MNQQNDAAPQQPEVPSAPASEAAYLGAVLNQQVATFFLEPDEFRQQRHEIIYARAVRRQMNGEPFDLALLAQELDESGELAICGGAQYLDLLAAQGALDAPVIDEHARLIRQKSTAFELQKLGASLLDGSASDLNKTLNKLTEEAENLKSRISISRLTKLTTGEALLSKFGDQKWLWAGYIPVGHVTGLIAQQGQGKSNVALDFCHRIATGATFPDGQQPGITLREKDRIFYLDSEGFLQGILTRLAAWGTPDERFIWPEGCDEKRWELNTPRGWSEFESIVAQYRPRLIVIDSLSGANSLEEKDNDQMKALMLNLTALAQKFQLALIFIHHLRKAGVGEPSYPIDLDRVRGASAITQFPRVVLAIGSPDKTQPTARRLDVIKCNLGAFAQPLGFEITEAGLAWGDVPEPPKSFKPKDGAADFLINYLSGVDKKLVNDIMEEGAAQGFKARTIYRAKEEVGIRVSKEPGQNGRTFWALVNQPE